MVNIYSYKSEFQGEDQTRAVRILLQHLKPLTNVFGLLYARRVEADLTIARHRKFDGGIDALWYLRDGMPLGTYRLMGEVARANRDTLRRYVALRGRALNRPRAEYGDLFASPKDYGRAFTIKQAIDTAVEASAPFGAGYQQRLRKLTESKWIDLPPRPSKRGVMSIYPAVGGAHPYFLMSYRPDYLSSRDFSGGMTSLMTYAAIPPSLAPDTRDDPPSYGNAMIYVGTCSTMIM